MSRVTRSFASLAQPDRQKVVWLRETNPLLFYLFMLYSLLDTLLFTSYKFQNICLNVNKSLINIMDLTQNDAAGYLGSGDHVHISFEYHIQGILWI